jgi:serine/threonine protein kinase/Flp pilus assembly protein TadD
MIGRQLQQYLIVEKVGEGGMGVVWQARDTRLERDVALKLLPDRIADDLGRERFAREAKSASALNHPNIVTIYEIDSDAGVNFIAMELIRGATLGQRLSQGPLGIPTAIAYATQIADALACAHQAGVIHRDLKPGNIMITSGGALKVLDFGLAKFGAARPDTDLAESPTFAPLTMAGLAVGTPDYMSPEQALGDSVDARSDVFAFGVVLYQMLTGKLPFRGSSRSDHLRQLHFTAPTPIATLRRDVPPALTAIVMKTLEKRPEDRYANMAEVRHALTHLAESAASVARRPSYLAILVMRPGSRTAAVLAILLSVSLAGSYVYQRIRSAELSLPAATAGATLPQSPYELTQRAALLLQRQDRPGNVDGAIRALEEALKLDQNYAPAHASLADAYRRKNSANPDPQWVRLAQEGARRALELNPDLAVAHTAQGFVDFDAGRFADAEARWRRAIELEPLNPMPHLGLGIGYAARKRDNEAEAALREAIKLRGADWRPDSELASFYYRHARYSEAAAGWEAARALAPDNNIIWRNLGAVYFQVGRYDDAAGAFQRALEIVPTAATYTNLGTLRFFQGRYNDAVPAFQKAVELGANRSLYWGNLADAYRWAPGRRGESIAAYNRAIALVREELVNKPADNDLRSRLALYLVKSDQTRDARVIVTEIEREPALTAPVLMRLTVIHELAGNRDRALQALGQAVAAGYSTKELSNEPELTTLRADARYHRVIAPPATPQDK